MRPFLLIGLMQVKEKNLYTVIRKSLRQNKVIDTFERNLAEYGSPEAALDINMFPNIISNNWNKVFSDMLGKNRSVINTLWTINAARNLTAHPGATDLDYEETRARLTDIASIMRRINAPAERAEVERIRDRMPNPRRAEPYREYLPKSGRSPSMWQSCSYRG